MKKCPYCAEKIQDEAIVCRYCGRDIRQVKPKKKTPRWMYVVVTVLFVCICVFAAINGSNDEKGAPAETNTPRATNTPRPTSEPTATKDPNKLYGDDVDEFINISQECVLRALKAPSTAKFSERYADYFLSKKDGVVTVQSWVDAENSFGAKLRSIYTAQFDYSTEVLLYLEIDGKGVYGSPYPIN